MRTPINNIGTFDDIPEPRNTNKKERPMTEITPLALKLRTAYRNSDATGDALWNEMAGVVEAELAAPRPVRLPTVEECHQAIGASCTNALVDPASVVIDLVASLNPAWVPVPADATIPAGTLVRVEEPGTVRATEFEWRPKDQVFAEDRATENFAYFVPSGTVLIISLDPRIEAAAKAIYTADQQDGDEQCWDTDTDAIRDTYVKLAKAAAEALGVTL